MLGGRCFISGMLELRCEDEPEHRVRRVLVLGVPHDGTSPSLELAGHDLNSWTDADEPFCSETDAETGKVGFPVRVLHERTVAFGDVPEPTSAVHIVGVISPFESITFCEAIVNGVCAVTFIGRRTARTTSTDISVRRIDCLLRV